MKFKVLTQVILSGVTKRGQYLGFVRLNWLRVFSGNGGGLKSHFLMVQNH